MAIVGAADTSSARKKGNKHKIEHACELAGDAANVNRSASRAVLALGKQAAWACEVLGEYHLRYCKEKGLDPFANTPEDLLPEPDLLTLLDEEVQSSKESSKRYAKNSSSALNLTHLQDSAQSNEDSAALLQHTERALERLKQLCIPLLHNQKVLRRRLNAEDTPAAPTACFVGFLTTPSGRVDVFEEGCVDHHDDFFLPLLRAKYAAPPVIGLTSRDRSNTAPNSK